MSLRPSQPESKRELAPAGTHRAVLFRVINLGTLKTEWEGKERDSHKIRLIWELTDETITYTKDDKEVTAPFSVGRKFTFSMGDNSHLYPIVQGMTGGLTEDERWNFDIESLLGSPCLVTVVHDESNGNKFAKIASATKLPKAMEVPTQVNPSEVLDVRKLSQEEIEALPDFLSADMEASNEYHVRFNAPRSETPEPAKPQVVEDAQAIEPEDIPFN